MDAGIGEIISGNDPTEDSAHAVSDTAGCSVGAARTPSARSSALLVLLGLRFARRRGRPRSKVG
jgi:hypothetical protein